MQPRHEVRWLLLVQQPGITIALYIAALCHEITLLYMQRMQSMFKSSGEQLNVTGF
jgi:hypothetical protein